VLTNLLTYLLTYLPTYLATYLPTYLLTYLLRIVSLRWWLLSLRLFFLLHAVEILSNISFVFVIVLPFN